MFELIEDRLLEAGFFVTGPATATALYTVALHRGKYPGGLFAATYEILYEDDDPGYRLQTSGRYAHDAGYLKSTGASAGLTLLQTARIPLRKSFDDLVDGFLMVFVKPDDENDGRASDQNG